VTTHKGAAFSNPFPFPDSVQREVVHFFRTSDAEPTGFGFHLQHSRFLPFAAFVMHVLRAVLPVSNNSCSAFICSCSAFICFLLMWNESSSYLYRLLLMGESAVSVLGYLQLVKSSFWELLLISIRFMSIVVPYQSNPHFS
jgi:hypothetical protein